MRAFSLVALSLLLALMILWPAGRYGIAWAKNAEPERIEIGSKSDLEIDRVDVLGMTVFTSTDVENLLVIGPGDRLERLKVLKTEENLQALYVRHGYEEVSIRSRLVRKRNENQTVETV